MKRAGAAGRKRQTGWHKDARMRMGAISFRPPDVLWTPTRWELLLRELGVTEAVALLLVREGTAQSGRLDAGRIRQWVRQNCRRAFVPEPVLAALGVGEAEVLERDIDREACAERSRNAAALRRPAGGKA